MEQVCSGDGWKGWGGWEAMKQGQKEALKISYTSGNMWNCLKSPKKVRIIPEKRNMWIFCWPKLAGQIRPLKTNNLYLYLYIYIFYILNEYQDLRFKIQDTCRDYYLLRFPNHSVERVRNSPFQNQPTHFRYFPLSKNVPTPLFTD